MALTSSLFLETGPSEFLDSPFGSPSRLGYSDLMQILSIATALFATSTALAGSFAFQFLPTSTVQQSLTITYPLAGTFIGSYDSATNPTGTRTIPGYFGGSGNNPIAYSASARVGNTLDSHPAGSFELAFSDLGVATVTGFTGDLLNGTPGSLDFDVTIAYAAFHTVAPTSIYPSVGAITIPIATGALEVATAVQAAPAIGTCIETAVNTYNVVVPIPVTVVVSGSAGGQTFGLDPTFAVIALTGTLTVDGTNATFIATAAQSAPIGPLPQLPDIVDQAVALPTVLPAGNTANLLFSGTFAEGSGTSMLNLSINAAGTASAVFGDLNLDHSVDAIDLAILLVAWGTDDLAADLNRDGSVDQIDLVFLIGNWTR